jgi:hypothetical protein
VTEVQNSRDFPEMYWAEVGNMLSWKLTFTGHNWIFLNNSDNHNMHAILRNGRILKMLDNYKDEGFRIFTGRRNIRFIQGVKITPKLEDKIEPFMVYATNTYGVNRSNVTNTHPTCRYDVVEVDCGNDESVYRIVLAIIIVEYKGKHYKHVKHTFTLYMYITHVYYTCILGELDCYFIGADLIAANKAGFRELPYDVYAIHTQRNNLYWSYFHISSIMRPVCFISTVETRKHFIKWCHEYTPGFRYVEVNMRFWCFTYSYCDRSNWNTMSDYSKQFHSLQDRDRLPIQGLEEEEASFESEYSLNSNSSEEMSVEE